MDESLDKKPVNLMEGKVAGVLSERELYINIGSSSGVTLGMKFKVLAAEPVEVRDPETDEVLGIIDREKVRVSVVDLKEKFSICKTYRKWTTRGGALYLGSLALNMLEAPKTVYETLKAEDSSLPQPLSDDESFVKRGDRVVQVANDQEN